MQGREALKKGLYFVHEYYLEEGGGIWEEGNRGKDGNTNEIRRNRIVLTKENEEESFGIEGYDLDVNEIEMETRPPEGSFLYFDGKRFSSAESDVRVIEKKRQTLQLAEDLTRRNYGNQPLELSGQITDVRSYHVNVGHGNCSIIAFRENGEGRVFMVDCSVFDFTDKCSRKKELDACLGQIKKEFQADKISKLLVTHLHYDHINGIEYLMEQGWVDGNTEIWMNIRYPWSQEKYKGILEKLKEKGIRIIDPVVGNSTQHVRVLYPVISFSGKNKAPKNYINNASVLYQVCLNGKSMLFPGDIETEGWNEVCCCKPYMNLATYYCISHHGSITGHLRTECLPTGKELAAVIGCIQKAETVILMGRDKAYHKIFSQKVLGDFFCSGKELVRVEKATNYVVLEWEESKVNFV